MLIWLTDLTKNNPHQVKLSEKIPLAWDVAEARNESFTIMNCITVASEHWSKVREVEMTMGQKQGGGGGIKDNGNDNANDPTRPPKKKEEEK